MAERVLRRYVRVAQRHIPLAMSPSAGLAYVVAKPMERVGPVLLGHIEEFVRRPQHDVADPAALRP